MSFDHTNPVTPEPRRASLWSFVWLALVAIVILGFWQRFSSGPSAVDWGTDFRAGLASASADGKRVLVSFSSPACTYCKMMEAEVIPQPEVTAEIGQFITVKIDATTNLSLCARYNVGALPAYLIVDHTGNALAMVDGYQPADRFIQFLRRGAAAARRGAQ